MSNEIRIELPGGFAPNRVIVKGDGPPVVFLHGPWGREWTPYLDNLAKDHRVYVPVHPGTDDAKDLVLLDDIWELALYYDNLFKELGLKSFDLIGHSFGGMIAAELAAIYPHYVRRLVLIDAMGLWRDDVPVEEHVTIAPQDLKALIYADQSRPEVIARENAFEAPEMKEAMSSPRALTGQQLSVAAREALLHRFSVVAATTHFCHPIPERGLSKRLYRVKADTLLVWGKQDKLVPPIYADEFASRIDNARIAIVDDAGHLPFLEQAGEVSRLTAVFLA